MYEVFIFEDRDKSIKALSNDGKHGTLLCSIAPRYRDKKYKDKSLVVENLKFIGSGYTIENNRLTESFKGNKPLIKVDGTVKRGIYKFKCLEDYNDYEARLNAEKQERVEKIIATYKRMTGLAPEESIDPENISKFCIDHIAVLYGYPESEVKEVLENN